MVLVDEKQDSSRIVGYHTLVFVQIAQPEIPDEKPKLKRPIPVILLGQLGVDTQFQGRGYGELLLMDAQSRVEEVSRRTGIRAMILDARTEELARWYEGYDFKRFPGKLRISKGIGAIRALKLQDSSR